MKRSLVTLIGCLAVSAAFAQAPDAVTSVNVVGFQKVTVIGGKLFLVNSAFEDVGGKVVLNANDVIGNQLAALPSGSKIYWFDPSIAPSGNYRIDQCNAFGTWSTNVSFRGNMGFWLQPGGVKTNDVYIKGQVPDAATTQTTVVKGLNQIGFPYTQTIAFTNTAIYTQAKRNDKLHVWNSANQNWNTPLQKNALGTWGTPGASFQVQMGAGYFLETTNALYTITEPIPYTL